jgi:long-chain fatty acid transport protein
LFGSTKAGIDMAQLFIAPTVAWKINENHTVGVSVNLAYQRFKAKGLENFTAPIGNPQQSSSSPDNITNKGYDHAYGAGLHLGWIGKVNDAVTLGATYQTKTYMTEFDKYKGLFAEQGDFDVPESYGFGLALKPIRNLTVAADYQRINYSDVNSVGNTLQPGLYNSKLGNSDGAGFGWRDVNVYKIGLLYNYSDNLVLRAGYNHTTQPIPQSQTYFNILAPGVVQDHLSLGFTYAFENKSELSLAYTHAFENKVRGVGSIPNDPNNGGGNANLKMYQDSLGIAYGWNM